MLKRITEILNAVVLALAVPQLGWAQTELSQGSLFLEKVKIGSLNYEQRMGFLLEAPGVPLKACVIYLEGLGDSLQNHFPLFNKLSRAGYRVLLFDYLGQGASEGEMAYSRIAAGGLPLPVNGDYEIGNQARFVWNRYVESSDPVYGRNCEKSPKLVLGWSTGGLAAYRLAQQSWASAVVLIAPGIQPNKCVGEHCGDITMKSLTRNTFSGTSDPHLDPIKPKSPWYAKAFAVNLLSTALIARHWQIPASVSGLVFLSGKEDTYVDREKSLKVLKRNASHFQTVSYSGALHELDNELPAVADDLVSRTVQFLDTFLKSR